MGGCPSLLNGVTPVFDGNEFPIVKWVRPAGDVSGNEDIVGHDGIGVERTTGSVARYSAGIRRQSRTTQPLRIAHRAEGDYRYVNIKRIAIGKLGAPKSSVRIALYRYNRDVTSQIDAVPTLHLRCHRTCRLTKRTRERRGAALGNRHGDA